MVTPLKDHRPQTPIDKRIIGRSQVEFGSQIWMAAVKRICKVNSDLYVFSPAPVWQLYGHRFLQATGIPQERVYVLPDGEAIKNLEVFAQLHAWLADQGADRGSGLLVLGGGVAGDLVGFVAASYMRGIDWFYVPTTLLSQQDASVGGKVAVNLPQGKNLVGHFWPPNDVVIDTDFLSSLPLRQLNAGFMELLKHGVLHSEQLMTAIMALPWPPEDCASIAPVLAQGVDVKAQIVERDPRESGDRKLLNLGHTLAHALETTMDYQLLHGEAVGYGLIFASLLARARGSEYDWSQMNSRIKLALPKIHGCASDQQLIDVISRDKKRRSGVLTWVIAMQPGDVRLCTDISEDQIKMALQEWRALVL